MVWTYRYVLTEHVVQWVLQGWEYVGPMMPIGGWNSSIIRRRDEPAQN